MNGYCFEYVDAFALTESTLAKLVEVETRCAAEPFAPEIIRDCVENLRTFVCRAGEEIVGFITVNPRSKRLGGSVYIVNINVMPEHRRRGLATGLIRTACAEWAEESFVSLDVRRDNPAMKLYENLGFVICDEASLNGNEDVMMSVRLSRLLSE